MKRMVLGLMFGVLVMGLGVNSGWTQEAQNAGDKPVGTPGKSVVTADKPAAEQPADLEQTQPSETAGEPSATASSLEVAEASIATGVENRAPVGAAETFPVGTEKLYCYSKIVGGKEGDEITHRWLKGTVEMSEVILKVNGSPWRTYSSKTLSEDAAGSWTVEILQAGKVLKTLKFEIK